jgi:hypothetical protein
MTAPPISMVANATSKEPKPVGADLVVEAIRKGKYRRAVDRVRQTYQIVLEESGGDKAVAKRAISELKKNLPAIQWSGEFSGRGDNALIRYSGLLCADLDDLSAAEIARAREKLTRDPHVYAVFLSPSGTGLKVVFAVESDASKHAGNFLAVQRHVADRYGLSVDESCRNLERLCFVSYDPDAYLNLNAVPLKAVAQEGKPAPVPPSGGEDLSLRQRIAAELLGEIDWESPTKGFVACPGKHLHTSGNGPKDCQVCLDRAPTLHCLHQHCAGIVAGVNFELRSRIGKSERGHYRRDVGVGEYLGNGETHDVEEPDPQSTTQDWPKPPAAEALHGLAGDVVRVIEPHSEADPAAVLVMFLAAFGNMIGASAHFMAEARKHFARIWTVLVGETAKGRKGSAWSSLRHLLNLVDPGWLEDCTASGLSSGEGLIYCVRDPVIKHKKQRDGTVLEVVEDEGVSDKRLFTLEEEYSAVLKVAARDGNIISDTLRRAWDSGDLRTMTRNSALRATGAHATIVGHVTRSDLSRHLADVDTLNGFANRFLWAAVRRSKLLPEGGALHTVDLASLILRLHRAVEFGRTVGLVERSPEARELWREIYPVLSGERTGLLGGVTNRAEAQVMRLALIYALLDCSPKIEVAHLRAALAVWDYCDRSAKFIFGESLGDKISDRILDELRCAGSRGLTRNELRELFGRNLAASKIEASLGLLHRLHLACWAKEARQGAGRPAVVWRASRQKPAPQAPAADLAPAPQAESVELPEPPGEAQPKLEPEAQLVGAIDEDVL